jgi:hypothetical protein
MPVLHSRSAVALIPLLAALAMGVPVRARAAAPVGGPPLTLQRTAGPIAVDGGLDDAGWKGATPVTQWYETRIGDNVEPQVRTIGWLAYDDRYLYVAFRCDDPDPRLIRAPIADRDQLSGNSDFAGVLIDSNNDGKSGIEFLANANGLMFDAVTNDASGEDSSPDFYWESAGRITATGWNLEIRIPFSSLRYANDAHPTWGIILFRNYARDRRYQFFSVRMPRDVSCFVCNESKLTGLADLPHGSHLVVAPYATEQRLDAPASELGSPLAGGTPEYQAGVDVKWSPLASMAVDATVNPDFSQVEGDVAQIGVNERFALFYPEKRSFFLEGKDLFATPLQAVYTRSINAPSVGLRVTGRSGHTSFTALGARDDGGGIVILPGPENSGFAPQDARSDVGVVRVRHDLGSSFVSLLATGRTLEGGGQNAVIGPDLEWRPRPTDTFAGQALWSSSGTPRRPDLAEEWDGRRLEDRALLLNWAHNTRSVDVYVQGQDIGPAFRADEGFLPQVGFREGYVQAGYTTRPKDTFFSRLRVFTIDWYDEDHDGRVLARRASVGAGADGRWSSFFRVELNRDDIKVGTRVFTRWRPYATVQASPGRVLNNVSAEVFFGDEIDFDNGRQGRGVTITGSMTLQPNDHLSVNARSSSRWLDVDDPALGSGRLFVAQVERLRTSWSFDAHTFIRLIGQYVQTRREPALYLFPVDRRESQLTLSALVAYKLNWQTVVYAGYGDDRAYAPWTDRLERSGRQLFAKVSYALQR